LKRCPSDEAKEQLHSSIRTLEDGARSIISDVSIRILPNDSIEIPTQNAHTSKCAVADPKDTSPADLIGDRDLGIRLGRADVSNGVSTVTMNPVKRAPSTVWHSSNDIESIESSIYGQTLSPGSLVCLSHDANWFLMWQPQSGQLPTLSSTAHLDQNCADLNEV
jgi:hypothetical protein